jgi:hypothetical protein
MKTFPASVFPVSRFRHRGARDAEALSLRSWATTVTSCAGANGFRMRMLFATPCAGHASATPQVIWTTASPRFDLPCPPRNLLSRAAPQIDVGHAHRISCDAAAQQCHRLLAGGRHQKVEAVLRQSIMDSGSSSSRRAIGTSGPAQPLPRKRREPGVTAAAQHVNQGNAQKSTKAPAAPTCEEPSKFPAVACGATDSPLPRRGPDTAPSPLLRRRGRASGCS